MRNQQAARHALCIGVLVLLAGCHKQAVEQKSGANPPTKPTPLPISAVSEGVNLTVYDLNGMVVLGLKADAAGANAKGNSTKEVVVQKGNATLYQKGKAVATLTANNLTAHTDTRTIEANGNVITKSLTQAGSPTIRADKMLWEHDKNLLTGSGHVLVTAEPAYSLPAESFTADTKLSHYRLKLAPAPGTGNY